MAIQIDTRDLPPAQRALAVHHRLLVYYGPPQWKQPTPPLDELISTVLSQNTNDTNRDRAYQALRTRFPTWEAVRDANLQEVIATIRPAGLANRKAPRILDILCQISAARGSLDLGFLGALPTEEARRWLLQFNGVGPKTAAIVLLFSLKKPAFPVDTHIYRVSGRIGLRPQNMSVEQTHIHLENLFPPAAYAAAHLNLIRLGREDCKARQVHCQSCPVNLLCDYFSNLSQVSNQP